VWIENPQARNILLLKEKENAKREKEIIRRTTSGTHISDRICRHIGDYSTDNALVSGCKMIVGSLRERISRQEMNFQPDDIISQRGASLRIILK
jgi:hypothetical protein